MLIQGTAIQYAVLPALVRMQPYALFTEYCEVSAWSTKILNFISSFPVAFSIKHLHISEARLLVFSITLWRQGGSISSASQIKKRVCVDTVRPKSLH